MTSFPVHELRLGIPTPGLGQFSTKLDNMGIVEKLWRRRVEWGEGTVIWQSVESNERKFLIFPRIAYCVMSFYSSPIVTPLMV
jgi:hypothetical protein